MTDDETTVDELDVFLRRRADLRTLTGMAQVPAAIRSWAAAAGVTDEAEIQQVIDAWLARLERERQAATVAQEGTDR